MMILHALVILVVILSSCKERGILFKEPILDKEGNRGCTYLGVTALLMWAIEPLLISEVERLPIFELLSIIFASSFLVTAFRLTAKNSWAVVKRQPTPIWVAGLIGICGSDFAYIHGAQYAPIAHVDLIDYLWPCVAVVLAGLLPGEKFSWKYCLGAGLGLSGIYFLIAGDGSLRDISTDYATGYALALIGAVAWGSYSAFSRFYKQVPTEMVGVYCGVGSIICFLLHLKFEVFVMPTMQEAGLAVFTGLTGAGCAYQLWDYGVKFGNIFLLSILTYAARILGMVLLVVFGKEPLTLNLVLACGITTAGVIICSINIKYLVNRIFFKSKKRVVDSTCSISA